jgi:hypothetical protein
MSKRVASILLIITFLVAAGSTALAAGTEPGYLSPSQIKAALEKIAGENKNIARVNTLGQTPGGRDILLLEMGPNNSQAPAVMVVANMAGDYPPASEAAVKLAQMLAGEWKGDLDARRWYIVALGNPDGYAHFFENPAAENFLNDRAVNDDNDDATDEDGPEDLNGDGFVTLMRQVHPDGKWIAVEGNPVLMKQADQGKGEKGMYRLFTEGIDNDGDGQINEDGVGGSNPGHNFPHDFQHYTKTDGLYPAGEPESRAILEFAFAHPEIAMLITFGRSNSLMNVPESSRKATGASDTYHIPERMAHRMGVDPEQEFTMAELIEMGKEATGMQDITEEMVLQFLGVGAAVNPDRNDLPYWTEISKRYKDFLKEAGFEAKRLKPADFPSGSIEEWGYFQYGVPVYAVDFWTLPEPEKKEAKKEDGGLTPEEVEKMSNEEFIALGPEKIGDFLKASGAPAQFTAEMVIQGLQGGMMTTKRMAEMMRQMKKEEEAGGADATEEALYTYNPDAFVAWQSYDHPTLGKVEIGGMKPYATLAPPADSVREVIDKQLPFVRTLAGFIPSVGIDNVEVEKMKDGIWKIKAWIANRGFLPYTTYQGSSGGVQKVEWLMQADEGKTITIKTQSFSAGTDERSVALKGGGR